MQTLLNQFTYFAFFQSILLLLIFGFSRKTRQHINGYFMVFVVVLLIGLSGKVILLAGLFGATTRLLALSEFATLLFGATIYLFVRSTLYKQTFRWKDLWHYLPALVYNLVMLFDYVLLPEEELTARIQSGAFLRWVTFFVGFGLFFNWLYWGLSVRLFYRFQQRLNTELSYTVKTRFLTTFLVAIGLCLSCWLVAYALSIFNHTFIERFTTQVIWLTISLLILLLAYYGIRRPELYQVGPPETDKPKYVQSRLSIAELDELKLRLDQLMLEQKPYLQQKLLKAELAELLGVSKPELARLLNERIGMNFFEYINYHRIREFIELARGEQASQLTFFGLAQEAGFNSKTTFNKAFKQLMGVPPSTYFKEEASTQVQGKVK
ncbi:MAG: helix-turn-helix domain-containing protein [Bacteroidota bacterium]